MVCIETVQCMGMCVLRKTVNTASINLPVVFSVRFERATEYFVLWGIKYKNNLIFPFRCIFNNSSSQMRKSEENESIFIPRQKSN